MLRANNSKVAQQPSEKREDCLSLSGGKLCEYNGFFLSGKFLTHSSSVTTFVSSDDDDFVNIKVGLFGFWVLGFVKWECENEIWEMGLVIVLV
nr:hypothetical protein [Tanacetum cinerariifolium]